MSVMQDDVNVKNGFFDARKRICGGALHPKPTQRDYSGAAFGNPFADDAGGGVEIQPGMILFSSQSRPCAPCVEIGADGRPERKHR